MVLGFAAVAAQSASAAHLPPKVLLRVSSTVRVTGTIGALGLAEITVGRMSCSLQGAKASNLAGGFAVGENVTVDCLDGSLHSIVLAPEASGPTHPDSVVQPITSGSGVTVTSSTRGSGTVESLTPSSITIGTATCSISQQSYDALV